MVEWYLIWILTIQNPSGVGTFDSREFSAKQLNETGCMIEATAREKSLETQLGKSVSYGFGLYAAYGGTLVGFSVGCEGRIKRNDKWIYIPKTGPDGKPKRKGSWGSF